MKSSPVSCLYCRKNIGPIRRLRDKHFCSKEHRRKLMSKSAKALREAEELYGFDGSQLPSYRAILKAKTEQEEEKPENRSGYGTSIFVAAAVAVLLLALSQVPMGGPAPKAAPSLTLANGGGTRSGFARMVGNLIQSKTSGTLREDFRAGLGNWEGLRAVGTDWTHDEGLVRPTALRLWKPSTSMSNYEMEFMGQIERKSMDWAFRASDTKNYYATKLIITRPGPMPNAGLIRFVVLDGRERERIELPLPLTLEKNTDYRVRVSVRGSRFLTSVNGQLVSSWTDNRLSRGGVGFFSENGEAALLKWVSVSERDSFLGRIVSHFSLISFPTAPEF